MRVAGMVHRAVQLVVRRASAATVDAPRLAVA